jgi:hypothetical protein
LAAQSDTHPYPVRPWAAQLRKRAADAVATTDGRDEPLPALKAPHAMAGERALKMIEWRLRAARAARKLAIDRDDLWRRASRPHFPVGVVNGETGRI